MNREIPDQPHPRNICPCCIVLMINIWHSMTNRTNGLQYWLSSYVLLASSFGVNLLNFFRIFSSINGNKNTLLIFSPSLYVSLAITSLLAPCHKWRWQNEKVRGWKRFLRRAKMGQEWVFRVRRSFSLSIVSARNRSFLVKPSLMAIVAEFGIALRRFLRLLRSNKWICSSSGLGKHQLNPEKRDFPAPSIGKRSPQTQVLFCAQQFLVRLDTIGDGVTVR